MPGRFRPTLREFCQPYHHQPEPPALVRERRPMLGAPSDPTGDSDAFGEWLAHLAAGRIEVR